MSRPVKTEAQPVTPVVAQRAVLFQPFSWHTASIADDIRRRSAVFAGAALDVAAGTRDVLSILEMDGIDESMGDEAGNPLPRLVSIQVTSNLTRFCITALDLLRDAAERHIAYIESQS